MTILRKFFGLELEAAVFCIALISIFEALMNFVIIFSLLCDDGSLGDCIVTGILSGLLMNVLLIFGTMKRKQNYLLPWLVISFIVNIIFGIIIILFTVGVIISLDRTDNDFCEQVFIYTIVIALFLAAYAINIYIFLAIYSLYVTFKNQHQQLTNESTTQDLDNANSSQNNRTYLFSPV